MKPPKNKKGPMLAAWKRGFQAYINGKSIDCNPYSARSVMGYQWFRVWREGWKAAEESEK